MCIRNFRSKVSSFDFGILAGRAIKSDASAALGIIQKQGPEKTSTHRCGTSNRSVLTKYCDPKRHLTIRIQAIWAPRASQVSRSGSSSSARAWSSLTGAPVLRRTLFDHIFLTTTTSEQSCPRAEGGVHAIQVSLVQMWCCCFSKLLARVYGCAQRQWR